MVVPASHILNSYLLSPVGQYCSLQQYIITLPKTIPHFGQVGSFHSLTLRGLFSSKSASSSCLTIVNPHWHIVPACNLFTPRAPSIMPLRLGCYQFPASC